LAYNAGPKNYKFGRYVEEYYEGVKAKRESFIRL